MHLHLEGPTGPHIQMELPPATDTELEPSIDEPTTSDDATISDNDIDEPDNGVDGPVRGEYVN